MPVYNPQDITHIANTILHTYAGDNALAHWYGRYQWQGADVHAAWQLRQGLQRDLIASGFALPALQAIHAWGFNHATCAALNHPTLLAALQTCLHAFATGTRAQQHRTLAAFLALQTQMHAKIGLARLSKWICMVDQSRYAILDSRVTRALYPIKVDAQHRAFPVMAGRAAGGSDSMAHWSPERVAAMYLDFTEVLQQVAARSEGLHPAQVEMALFMAGQQPLPRPLQSALRRGMWIWP